jgi:hypothetical protein
MASGLQQGGGLEVRLTVLKFFVLTNIKIKTDFALTIFGLTNIPARA